MDVYGSIVITGGGGMLARDLVNVLRARGHAPVAVRRSECDITDTQALATLFESYRPTLLLNCAAHTGVDLAEDEPDRANAINGTAVANLSQLATKYQTKLVHFSTDFVFDGRLGRPYRPTDQTNPLSVYGSSKLLGETNVQAFAPSSSLVIRTSWLFGRYGNCFPQTIVKLAKAGRPLRVVNDQRGCPTYTTDLAHATLNLVDRHATGIVHVTNSGETSWFDFAVETLRQCELEADIAPVTTAEWLAVRPKQAKRPLYSAMDTSEYVALTRTPLRPWSEALQEHHAGPVNTLEM